MQAETGFWITPEQLQRRIGTDNTPIIRDVRRREIFEAANAVVATASWGDHREAQQWGSVLPADAEIVVYCVHGHQVSQSAVAALRAMGRKASCLAGGFAAFVEADGTTLSKSERLHNGAAPRHWITRSRPKIDAMACCWLIRRFLQPDAQICYVAADQVLAVAEELGAMAFDIDGATFSPAGGNCSFDAIMSHFEVSDSALAHLARIVRGADTGRLELEPECAGLVALSLGVAGANADDHDALGQAMTLYDALYAWSRDRAARRHDASND